MKSGYQNPELRFKSPPTGQISDELNSRTAARASGPTTHRPILSPVPLQLTADPQSSTPTVSPTPPVIEEGTPAPLLTTVTTSLVIPAILPENPTTTPATSSQEINLEEVEIVQRPSDSNDDWVSEMMKADQALDKEYDDLYALEAIKSARISMSSGYS